MKLLLIAVFLFMSMLAVGQDSKPVIPEKPQVAKVEEPKLPAVDANLVEASKPFLAQRDQIVAQAQVLYKQLNDLNTQMNEVNRNLHIIEEKALSKADLDYTQYMLDVTGTKFQLRPQQGQPTAPTPER